jgi:hypothetical protein
MTDRLTIVLAHWIGAAIVIGFTRLCGYEAGWLCLAYLVYADLSCIYTRHCGVWKDGERHD